MATDKDRRACASKAVYATRTIAKRTAKTIKRRGKKSRAFKDRYARLRPYQCPACGLWHLTSAAPRLRDLELTE